MKRNYETKTPQLRIMKTLSEHEYAPSMGVMVLEHMMQLSQNQKEQIAQRVEELISEKKTEKQILQALGIK